jgi:LacI family transcriptional regulator
MRDHRSARRGRHAGAARKPAAPKSMPAIKGKVTIKDLARASGVSVATVSRVLNNPSLVTADKQKAVQRVLRRYDYIPNQHARSLISRRSRAIGLIVPTITNPVFAPTIDAIERECDKAGYALLIHCCDRDPQKELEQARTLVERGVDGLIVTGSLHLPAFSQLLKRVNVPFVSQDIAIGMPLGPSIALDNAGAMAAAIDHLHAQGHRAIAVFSGPVENTPPVRDRMQGALDRIRHHRLAMPKEWCVVADDYEAGTMRDAARALVRQARRPTAVALTGDILALALVAECRAAGLAVPADISIIGCGDTNMGQYVDPPLTTMHMPFDEMGRIAATGLFSVIAGQTMAATTVLPYTLTERQSVAAVAS